jgi:hypothetical protein
MIKIHNHSSFNFKVLNTEGTFERFRPSSDNDFNSVSIERLGIFVTLIFPMKSLWSPVRVCTTDKSVIGFSLK